MPACDSASTSAILSSVGTKACFDLQAVARADFLHVDALAARRSRCCAHATTFLAAQRGDVVVREAQLRAARASVSSPSCGADERTRARRGRAAWARCPARRARSRRAWLLPQDHVARAVVRVFGDVLRGVDLAGRHAAPRRARRAPRRPCASAVQASIARVELVDARDAAGVAREVAGRRRGRRGRSSAISRLKMLSPLPAIST